MSGQYLPTPKEKKCLRCGRVKPAAAFNKCARSADGLYTYCRQCRREMYRKDTGRNPLARFTDREIEAECLRRKLHLRQNN